MTQTVDVGDILLLTSKNMASQHVKSCTKSLTNVLIWSIRGKTVVA